MRMGLVGIALASLMFATPTLAQENDDFAVRDCIDSKSAATIMVACSTVLNEDGYMKAVRAIAYVRRGAVFADQGKYDRAIYDFTKAIEIDDEYAAAYNARARAYLKSGQPTEAFADSMVANELQPNYPEGIETQALCYETMEGDGAKVAAITLFRKALELDPSLVESKAGLKRLTASPKRPPQGIDPRN